MRFLLTLALAATLLLPGCTEPASTDAGLGYSLLDIGQRSGHVHGNATAVLINDAPNWIEFWINHTFDPAEKQNAPLIDFEKRFAVALFIGAFPSEGYAVRVDGLAYENSQYEVSYTPFIPAGDCPFPERPTNPYAIILIDRYDGRPPAMTYNLGAPEPFPCTA